MSKSDSIPLLDAHCSKPSVSYLRNEHKVATSNNTHTALKKTPISD